MMKRYYPEVVMIRHAAELYKRNRHEWWRLKDKKVLIAGAGGLGARVLSDLLGIGPLEITVVDKDVVEIHNLNRQFFFGMEDVGKKKTEMLQKRLSYRFEKLEFLDEDVKNIDLQGYNVVIDCLDRWKEKMNLLQRSVELNIPYVLLSSGRGIGMVSVPTKKPPITPRDECIVSSPELSVTAGIGVNEALNILLNKDPLLKNKLLIVDLNSYQWEIIEY